MDVPAHLVQRLWAELRCGCGRMFIAEPDRVPCFQVEGRPNMPCCRDCWDRRNQLRAALGMPVQGRPSCYPSDYPER